MKYDESLGDRKMVDCEVIGRYILDKRKHEVCYKLGKIIKGAHKVSMIHSGKLYGRI